MQQSRALLLRYAEVALKGANRGWFEERLAMNARKMLEREGIPNRFIRHHGRVLIQPKVSAKDGLTEAQIYDQMVASFPKLFGLTNFSPIRIVPTHRDLVQAAVMEETALWIERYGMPRTFRIKCVRSDKVWPEKSFDIERWLGSLIGERYPQISVDLENPDLTVGLELRFKNSYIWTDKHLGPGGLPVGTNNKLLALMSGGIDSPVAALRAMRRGSPTDFIHFYGTPFVGPEVLEKIEDLTRQVNRYQPEPQSLFVVPFGKIQEKIALATNPKVRTLLYRRMMIRVASEVAKRIGSLALVTGDSVGQVASQTVANLVVMDQAASVPIFRPLNSMDKVEIINQAHKWDTFKISVRPGLDCCTLFADRHPMIHGTPELLIEEEKKFDVAALVKEALDGVERRRPSRAKL